VSSREITAEVFRVKVIHSSETELCTCEEDVTLRVNDIVIVPTKYGNDLGKVLGAVHLADEDKDEELQSIVRVATDDDLKLFEENKEKERKALEICKEKVEARKLEMKLVSAHYIPEETKVLFFFTAENRVDFRELVKDLVSVFKMRIELRQIGVRDESRVLGGVGVCGRHLCCHGVTDKLQPVSIKMAKEQNLSLNSMKISGPCGRLLCCLAYEYDQYKTAKKNLPSEGSKVFFQGEKCKIQDINILTRVIRVVDADGKSMEIPVQCFRFSKEDNSWYAEQMSCEDVDADEKR
jgi:cell fate regulator YaaT (PSP1 superfamily)